MRLILLGLACAACTSSEPLTPSLELVGAHIVASGEHVDTVALEVRLTGPYEVGGQVKVRNISFLDIYGDDESQSWVYVPLAVVPTDASYPADGDITLVDAGTTIDAFNWHCGKATLFLAVSAAVEGDHHQMTTEAIAKDVPVACN
jgi:hypothetical protein